MARRQELGGTAPLEVAVDPVFAAASSAREQFVRWLEAQGADEVAVAELAVVVSELMSNAVRAAQPCTNPTLVASVEDGRIALEVGNTLRPGSDILADWDHRDPLRGGGRGLLLVESFVDEIDVIPDATIPGVTVRCRRRLSS